MLAILIFKNEKKVHHSYLGAAAIFTGGKSTFLRRMKCATPKLMPVGAKKTASTTHKEGRA